MLLISRITVLVVSAVAFMIALDPNSSVMGLVSNAWAGFGATFGPVVLMSLFWKRSNVTGAAFGMIAGGLTVILWDYIPCSEALPWLLRPACIPWFPALPSIWC